MILGCLSRRRRPQQGLHPRSFVLLVPLLMLVLIALTAKRIETTPRLEAERWRNISDLGAGRSSVSKLLTQKKFKTARSTAAAAGGRQAPKSYDQLSGPYHNWRLFTADYQEMMHNLKIYVYPDAFININNNNESSFASVFLPHPNPNNPKLGNYFSEHVFKTALIRSSFVTPHPEEAHFFFMPFSINAMRNHHSLHSEASISDFVAQYTARISSEFNFWNASGGANHFYVCCHSVSREAASKRYDLHNNAIQVTCSSSYFQRLYIAHKDVGLPQVWPRPPQQVLNPPDARNRLVFFAGRMQNSRIREKLIASWGNDTSMDIFYGNLSFPYEEGFRRSRYCLHVKGYEVLDYHQRTGHFFFEENIVVRIQANVPDHVPQSMLG